MPGVAYGNVGYGGAASLGGIADGSVLKAVAGAFAAAVAGTDYVAPLGVAGGQTVNGGTLASQNLTLSSTAHATKGSIIADSTLVLPAGTQAAPSLQFVDANTGFWRIGAGILGLSLNAVQAIKFYDTVMAVYTDVSLPATKTVFTGTIAGPEAVAGANLDIISTSHATKGQVRIGSSTGLVHDGVSGNVGIGVAPEAAYRFKVQASGASVAYGFFSSGGGGFATMRIGSTTETETAHISGGANDATGTLMGVAKANASFFYGGSSHTTVVVGGVHASSEVVIAPGNAEKLRITGAGLHGGAASAGNLDLASTTHATKGLVRIGGATGLVYDETNKRLGIGVATPTSTLHVIGAGPDIFFDSTSASSSASSEFRSVTGARLIFAAYGTSVGATIFGISTTAGLTAVRAQAGLLLLGTVAADDLVLGTNNAERMRINAGGAITCTNAVSTVASATGAYSYENSHVDSVSSYRVRHTSGSRDLFLESYGSNAGSTVFGQTRNSASVMRSNNSTLLAIGTTDAKPLYLGTADTTRVQIDALGNVVIGTAALATTATDGFPYIPGGAGPPTGTPTAFTGRHPLYWDTTNKKLHVYDGAWLGATAPGVWS